MEDTVIHYYLPEIDNHSFFFINQCIEVELEAKLHQHDAWELYCVTKGKGNRLAGDTVMPFSEGDLVLIPPMMLHRWEYQPDSADSNGCVSYLMVAFSHNLVEKCISIFPEVRNALVNAIYPSEAMKFGCESSALIRKTLSAMDKMDELGRLREMLGLLPYIFNPSDYILVGNPMKIERDVRRLQQISEYVMAHYVHRISLDEIASEVGMNRSAFCSYFKKHKGVTFSRFVTQYRLNTACDLLQNSKKQISEICYLVGFCDVPHFVRVFTKTFGMSPTAYRKSIL